MEKKKKRMNHNYINSTHDDTLNIRNGKMVTSNYIKIPHDGTLT